MDSIQKKQLPDSRSIDTILKKRQSPIDILLGKDVSRASKRYVPKTTTGSTKPSSSIDVLLGKVSRRHAPTKSSIDILLKKITSPSEDVKDMSAPSLDKLLDTERTKIEEELTKPTVDRVAEILNDPTTTRQEKIKRVVDRTVGKLVTEEEKSILSAWLWDASKNILWTVALSAALYLAVTVVYTAFVGGSWWSLLSVLKHFFGEEALPIVSKTLKSMGVVVPQLGITGAMMVMKRNPRYRKILEQKVPDWYITRTLGNLGLVSKNMNLEDLITTLGNVSIQVTKTAVFGGNMSNLLYSVGLGLSFKAGVQGISSAKSYLMQNLTKSQQKNIISPKVVAENLTKRSIEVKSRVAKKILNETVENIADDVVKIVVEENAKFTEDVEKIADKTGKVVPPATRRRRRALDPLEEKKSSSRSSRSDPVPPPNTETPKTLTDTIMENKLLMMAGTASISLVTVALTGNAEELVDLFSDQLQSLAGSESVARLGNLALAGFDIAKESSLAKNILYNALLDKVGIGKLINDFSDYLTAAQKIELKNLAQAIKHERNKSLARKSLDRFFGILSGGYMSLEKLQRLPKSSLVRLYRELNPSDKNYSKYDENTLRFAIHSHQLARIQRLNSILTAATRKGMKKAAKIVMKKSITLTAAQIQGKLDEFDSEAKKFEQMMVNKKAEADALAEKLTVRRSERLAKLQDESIRAKQLAEAEEERKRIMEDIVAREKLAELQRLQEIEDLKEKFRAERTAKKLAREEAHKKAVERIEKKRLLRDLADAEYMNEMSKIMDVVVVDVNGESYPLASEELLVPEELREMTDWYVTPLIGHLAKEAAAASTNLIPGVGWVNNIIRTVNKGLGLSETVKDVSRIRDFLVAMEKGESLEQFSKEHTEKLDALHSIRIPTLDKIVDDVIQIGGKTHVQDIVIRAMKDKALNGWDMSRTQIEIGKNLMKSLAVGQEGEMFSFDFSGLIGGSVMSKIFGE
jgi:hypothetical protein